MSENMRLFGTVNDAGIVNSHSEFFSLFALLLPISERHTPISSVWPVVSHHLFIAITKSTVQAHANVKPMVCLLRSSFYT